MGKHVCGSETKVSGSVEDITGGSLQKLREYIEESGAWAPEANGIKTVRSLLDIMLITGVIHGGTLSMTRQLAKPEFYRWRNIDEDKWNANGDVFSAAIGLST